MNEQMISVAVGIDHNGMSLHHFYISLIPFSNGMCEYVATQSVKQTTRWASNITVMIPIAIIPSPPTFTHNYP